MVGLTTIDLGKGIPRGLYRQKENVYVSLSEIRIHMYPKDITHFLVLAFTVITSMQINIFH